MEWTSLNNLREIFLKFFESKDHLRLPSFPLVPQGDKSLLLINAGMAPMKKYFTGELTPPHTRVTTCQKCIRTPDIERVGKTSRHGTYFEMLGNFSFGDYFKREAITWAWEFCIEVIGLPAENLYISVYKEDDEAYDIWTKEIGVSPEHMLRLGKEDNFWELGVGPCGPCSEIHYDRGEKYGCGSPDCKVGCDCDRFVEFWNLVFTQFDNDGNNNYSSLKKRNIDTGMGLERLACIVQGVDNLFEVDTVRNIMKHVQKIAGVEYHKAEKNDVSLRVITDHIRSTTFMISDGVMPSNEGRGYVLRRLLRRAARHGRLLGIEQPFLAEVCETVIKENKCAYPNLVEKHDFIVSVISNEEENFNRTIDSGLNMLNGMLDKMKETGSDMLSGEDAFKLSDTFGFPIDLTKEILEEKNMSVDEKEFERLAFEQRERSRKSRKDAGADGWKNKGISTEGLKETNFIGYEHFDAKGEIAAIFVNGEKQNFLESNTSASIVIDSTSFYAESGGQVGDIGVIEGDDFVFEVNATDKTNDDVFLHHGSVIKGEGLKLGDNVISKVDKAAREATQRNHTAAHLLQSALREVLGTHVEQAGQLVNPKEVRFDFTHFTAMTSEEIKKVESLVNEAILSALEVSMNEMSIEEAKKVGAMALFGEKYADVVRVVRAGDFSTELCGGTHVDNTGKLGLFKIISEYSVAAGVRRIEGVTGFGVLDFISSNANLIQKAAQAMKLGNVTELSHRASTLVCELKAKEKEIESLNAELSAIKAEAMMKDAVEFGGIKLLTSIVNGSSANEMRSMTDKAKESANNIVAVIGGVNDKGTVSFSVACASEAVKLGVHAGKLVKAIAQIAGGSGGGRPDSAMAGAKDTHKVKEAIASAQGIVSELIK